MPTASGGTPNAAEKVQTATPAPQREKPRWGKFPRARWTPASLRNPGEEESGTAKEQVRDPDQFPGDRNGRTRTSYRLKRNACERNVTWIQRIFRHTSKDPRVVCPAPPSKDPRGSSTKKGITTDHRSPATPLFEHSHARNCTPASTYSSTLALFLGDRFPADRNEVT